MFDKLRDQIAGELGAHQVGVLSCAGEFGPLSIPVRYRTDGVEVECLLPRWSEPAYALEQSERVVLIVLSAAESDQRWVRYLGLAQVVPVPDWSLLLPDDSNPADKFVVARIRPTRIDLIDLGRGWGARETLDFA